MLACVDTAAIIHNGKVVAQGTPTSLVQNIEAQNVYLRLIQNKPILYIYMKKYLKICEKIKPYNKSITIDGDKSLSIRWALIASQASGKSFLLILKSDDVLNTLSCLKS